MWQNSKKDRHDGTTIGKIYVGTTNFPTKQISRKWIEERNRDKQPNLQKRMAIQPRNPNFFHSGSKEWILPDMMNISFFMQLHPVYSIYNPQLASLASQEFSY